MNLRPFPILNIHFNRAIRPMDSICREAGSLLQEFLQSREVELSPPRPQVIQRWRPPNPYFYKINFDATVFQASNSAGSAGVGVIAGDNRGDSIGALTLPIPFRQSVVELEALACQRTVQFALEIGLNQVVIERDSVTFIEVLKNSSSQFASYGNVLDDIWSQSTGFQYVEFSYTSRVCNSVADALAKKAKSGVGFQVWLEDLPDDIAPFVFRGVH